MTSIYMFDEDAKNLINSLQIAIKNLGTEIGDLKNNLNMERKRIDKLQNRLIEHSINEEKESKEVTCNG